jgi:CDP-diacylglycerol--glycerol-3-phosphate 3-phosphatidyltransferase
VGEPRARRAPLSSPEQRWSALHHDIDPRRVPLLLPWLRGLWSLARALRGVPPTAITVLGVVLAADAVFLARDHPGWAALAVLAAALCDGVDGAIAVIADRASRSGAIADAVADRVADVAFAGVLWRVGVPLAVAIACAAAAVAVDVLRRLRRVPDRITVGERPTWTICATLAGCSAAVSHAHWPVLACAVVWLSLGAIAVGQVAAARR